MRDGGSGDPGRRPVAAFWHCSSRLAFMGLFNYTTDAEERLCERKHLCGEIWSLLGQDASATIHSAVCRTIFYALESSRDYEYLGATCQKQARQDNLSTEANLSTKARSIQESKRTRGENHIISVRGYNTLSHTI